MKLPTHTLRSLADPTYQAFMANLLPGVKGKILGVRMPALRAYAKQITQEDWRHYLKSRADASHEGALVRGLIIAQAKMDLSERLTWARQYIPRIYSWALCDSFCSALKTTKKYPDDVWSFMQPYFHSTNEYELRFCVVMSMLYFLRDATIDDVLANCVSIRHEGHYVKMAVAWALSVACVTYPKKITACLMSNALDRETHNMTIRKIGESYRISPAQKTTIKRFAR
jgi:3-methyladenine DNA glycosylase AlkD